MPSAKSQPIEIYRGIPIHKNPRINIRVSVPEMKRFIDAKIDTGLSAKEAIKERKIFCTPCSGINVSVYK